MNQIKDPLQVVADLEPAMLNQMAEIGYSRRRHDDLARIVAEDSRHAAARSPRRSGRQFGLARPRLSGLTVGLAAVAAAAVAVAVAVPAGLSSQNRQAPQSAPGARGFLLASAEITGRAPATTGHYWYIRERDFEPSATHSKNLTFGASYAATEETWIRPSWVRTIVDEDLRFSFASAADKARWHAAGSPALSSAAGFGYQRPIASDQKIRFHWGIGVRQLSMPALERLPGKAAELGKLLRHWWNHEPDQAAAVGLPHPSFGEYLVGWADILLTGPARQGTKAAIYRLLADQPGITIITSVTDPLGRTGVAIGDGGGDYLIIDPHTARLLAYTANPVHRNSVIRAAAGVSVYVAMGWASQPGVAPGS